MLTVLFSDPHPLTSLVWPQSESSAVPDPVKMQQYRLHVLQRGGLYYRLNIVPISLRRTAKAFFSPNNIHKIRNGPHGLKTPMT